MKKSVCSLIRKKSDFSLIELLIVVAIIAVLISLINPALRTAIENAQVVHCLNNARNLTMGWNAYHTDHNGRFVKALNYNDVPDGEPWVKRQLMNDSYETQKLRVEEGAMFEYIGSVDAYGCINKEDNEVRTYSSNHVLDGLNVFVTNMQSSTVYKTESQLPGRRMNFMDDWKDQDDACFAIYRNRSSWWNTAPRRHTKGIVMSYTDGSAEYYQYHDPRSLYSQDLVHWGQGNYRFQAENEDIRYIANAIWGSENVTW